MAVEDSMFVEMLNMTCTIQRDDGTGGTNERGKVIKNWANHLTNVLCTIQSKAVAVGDTSVQVIDAAKAVVNQWVLWLPPDIDVVISDRISNVVRTEDSAVIQAGSLYILERNPFNDPELGDEHHVELLLQEVES